MVTDRSRVWCVLLASLAAGCQPPPVGADGNAPRIAAQTQVMQSQLVGSSHVPARLDDAFADLEGLLPASSGSPATQQVGPIRQVSGPGGRQQIIQTSPNPATNLQGFLGDVFSRVGIGGQSSQQGMVFGSGGGQSISQSSQGGGIQQSVSMGSGSGGMQQQTMTNADGSVSVVQSGPAGTGVWRSVSQTYPQGGASRPVRTVDTTVTRDGPCLEITQSRILTVRPDGTQGESLSLRREDVCTGDSLGDVRAQVRLVEGESRLVGTVVLPDGTVRPFSRPYR
jgi:hypothetical protein